VGGGGGGGGGGEALCVPPRGSGLRMGGGPGPGGVLKGLGQNQGEEPLGRS